MIGSLAGRRPKWLNVLLFLIVTRLLVNIPLLVGANAFPFSDSFAESGLNPTTFPGVWARWDSLYYFSIAENGYTYQGPEVNFFPLYPLLIRILSFGDAAHYSIAWSSIVISSMAFILAGMILWHQVSIDFDEGIAWSTVITLSLFPTAFFFSAIYTESLFLLFSVFVYYLSARRRFLLAGLFVSLASITRITGILLIVIPLTEIMLQKRSKRWLRGTVTVLISGALLAGYGLYNRQTQDSPIAFITTQRTDMQRVISWPGKSLLDSLRVILWGYGGFERNWFMRAVSFQDWIALSLFSALAALSVIMIHRKSLVIYFMAGILVLLMSHGPNTLGVFSMARYVLVLFPGFIVIGILLDRLPKLKWVIWGISTLLLTILTAWYGNWGWVA